jgi:hypothetical protein
VTDSSFDAVGHWNSRHRSTPPTDVSWFEDHPTTSMELIDAVLATAADLRDLVAPAEVVVERRSTHVTPSGAEQRFRWFAGWLR